jgi:hypothetical protein
MDLTQAEEQFEWATQRCGEIFRSPKQAGKIGLPGRKRTKVTGTV